MYSIHPELVEHAGQGPPAASSHRIAGHSRLRREVEPPARTTASLGALTEQHHQPIRYLHLLGRFDPEQL